MNIYVGNLSFDVSEADLEKAFEEYGRVKSIKIVMDRDTGKSRGFAFVEMEDGREAREAIEGINLRMIDGRAVTVNEARPRRTNNRW